jgi:hypothetical protein
MTPSESQKKQVKKRRNLNEYSGRSMFYSLRNLTNLSFYLRRLITFIRYMAMFNRNLRLAASGFLRFLGLLIGLDFVIIPLTVLFTDYAMFLSTIGIELTVIAYGLGILFLVFFAGD